jgi:hypothetical protein
MMQKLLRFITGNSELYTGIYMIKKRFRLFRLHTKVFNKQGEKYQGRGLEISVPFPDSVQVWFANSYRGVHVKKNVTKS